MSVQRGLRTAVRDVVRWLNRDWSDRQPRDRRALVNYNLVVLGLAWMALVGPAVGLQVPEPDVLFELAPFLVACSYTIYNLLLIADPLEVEATDGDA
jgi:type II secretory pathway component PulM